MGKWKRRTSREQGKTQDMAYFTQQLINAITLGAIYGLIAIGQ